MPKPDFLVIGAQKGGTTWLYENLAMHPAVWSTPVKELHYFNRVCMNSTLLGYWDMPHPRGVDRFKPALSPPSVNTLKWIRHYYSYGLSKEWYLRLFSDVFTEGKVSGDITPDYSSLEEPGVKFAQEVVGKDTPAIFIVRNPIERSWSAAKMIFRYRQLSPSEENMTEMLALLEHPVIRAYSEYVAAITLWRKYFHNFHVLTYDELCDNPELFLSKVADIIGIQNSWDAKTVGKRVWSDKKNKSIPEHIHTMLEDHYRQEIEGLGELITDNYIKHW